MARNDVLVERSGSVATVFVPGSGRHGNGVGQLAAG
jgi:hypothetical protein